MENLETQLYALRLIANHEEMTPREKYEEGLIWVEELKCYYSPEDIATAATTKTAQYSTLRKILETRAKA